MAIAIIGPTSYIAQHLASTLEGDSKEYYLLSLRDKGETEYEAKDNVVFRDELTKRMEEDMAISSAVLCASMTAKDCEQDPARAGYINTRKVLDMVHAMAEAGTKRFMYLSTIKVYGEDLNGRITESTSSDPETIYAKTHYDTEVALRELAAKKDLEVLVVRLSNVFGAPVFNKESAWSLAANCFAKQMASRGSIDVKSPEVIRNLLPMEKLVSFIERWIDNGIETQEIEVINMGSKATVSMRSLAQLVEGCFNEDIGEADIESMINTEKTAFQYSTDFSLRVIGRSDAEDSRSIWMEMRRLCDASKELFGQSIE